MKNLIAISIVLFALLASCKKASKDYVTFSGKILNSPNDSLFLLSQSEKQWSVKGIRINEDGTFSDTLKVKGTNNFMLASALRTLIISNLYLKNGMDLHLEGNFSPKINISFTGEGAAENNYLYDARVRSFQVQKADSNFSKTNEEIIQKAIKGAEENVAFLNTYKEKLDPSFYKEKLLQIQSVPDFIKARLEKEINYAKGVSELNGKPSPTFTFENYKGGTTSLEDFKGKYVYIDLWATWCAPCVAEIPFLEKIEKEYHDKNIVFVSISQDIKKNFEEWKKMVADKNMGGVQLNSNGANSSFYKDYRVERIPRFILIDPRGIIVSAEAPKPSDPKLKELLNSLPL